MKTGRRDGKESHVTMVEEFIPNHNDSISLVLSRFQAIGVDVEATVALLGTTVHSNIYFFWSIHSNIYFKSQT
jgi:hypothetical protein